MIKVAVIASAALAGSAMAQVTSVNALNFNAYENFRNPASVLPSTLTLNGAPVATAYNQNIPAPLGPTTVREIYAPGQGGYANRHIAWLSNNGGASPYSLQAGESFFVSACYRVTAPGYPSGIGAPVNVETGFWMHNPRVNETGTPFIDEGGTWLISNGTSFTGGNGADFFLYGEGGWNNPASPPIMFLGDEMEISYMYWAAGSRFAGSHAAYEATVRNVTRGISVYSGLKNFNPIPGSNEDGLNPGTTIGFRVQNQVFPGIMTDVTTEIGCITVVPAPASLALLGLGGLAAIRRRR